MIQDAGYKIKERKDEMLNGARIDVRDMVRHDDFKDEIPGRGPE